MPTEERGVHWSTAHTLSLPSPLIPQPEEVKYEPAKRPEDSLTLPSSQLRRSIGGVTGKFKRMCKVYELFSEPWRNTHRYDDEMIVEMFNFESLSHLFLDERGNRKDPCIQNGYWLGKKWLNVTINMWKEDLSKGYLFKHELYQDSKFPTWWLDSVLKDMHPRGWKQELISMQR